MTTPAAPAPPGRLFELVIALVGAALGLGLAGLVLTISGIAFLVEVEHRTGDVVFLRHRDLGPGLGTTILGGVALAAVAAVAFVGPSRRMALAVGVGLAVPLAVERIGMDLWWKPADIHGHWRWTFGLAPVLVVAITAVVAAVVVHVHRPPGRQRWAPGVDVEAGRGLLVGAGGFGVLVGLIEVAALR